MLIRELGEFGLIEKIKRRLKLDSSVIVGPGDDCAVLKYTADKYQLFTCDMLVEGVDFTAKTDLRLVGRKAIAVSLSDIAACGGKPKYCVVSLGLPGNISLQAVERILSGMTLMTKKFKVNLVGGDISRAEKLILDVSMLGEVEKHNLALRNGAKKGDMIFVTGSLGGTLKGKHLAFIPRVKVARYLVKNYQVNAMIDISDGLLQDLGHILKQSRVGAVIYEELIPQSKDSASLEDALAGGEDFELLFTLPRRQAKRLIGKRLAAIRPIGEVTDAKFGLKLLSKNAKERKISAGGFRHF